MAKLEKRKVTKNVYHLELEQEELDALYLILRRIGGDPYTSYRKYSDNIFKLTRNNTNLDEWKLVMNGNPYFIHDNDSLIFKEDMI